METTLTENAGESSAPPGQSATVVFLRRYLELAEKGELQSVLIGYMKTDGGAAVQSTPMSSIALNHLCRLLDRRVSREYDRAMAAANPNRSPSGPVPITSPQSAAAQLPRKVRRAVAAKQRNLQKLAEKKQWKAQANGALIRRAPSQG